MRISRSTEGSAIDSNNQYEALKMSSPNTTTSSDTVESGGSSSGELAAASGPAVTTGNQLQHHNLRREEFRLSTFEKWPANAKMEARKIAKAGLYYTGQYQEAKCPWCQRIIATWDYGEQAIAKHRTLSPDCAFVLGTSDNIPMLRMTPSPTPSPASLSRSASAARDVVDTAAATTGSGRDHDDEEEMQEAAEPAAPDVVSQPRSVNVESQEFLSEAARLRTFQGWPLTFILPADLANAGFIYTGQDDVVQCVFCREFIGRWEEEDSPYSEHRAHYPHCPFVMGREVGNVPIQRVPYNPFAPSSSSTDSWPFGSAATATAAAAEGEDVTGIKENLESPSSQVPDVNRLINPDGASGACPTGIIRHTGPANARFNTLEARIRSFSQSWPPQLRQRPQELAEAGFFHIGQGDRVKCFHCDGGLMNWQPEDDPWTEHARYFSQCGFLRLVKGDEFIAQSIQQNPPQPVPGLPEAAAASIAISAASSVARVHVDEDNLRKMLSSPLVDQVVAMGIPLDKIRSALQKKIQASGTGYKNAHDLAEAAIKEPSSSSSSSNSSDDVTSGANATNDDVTSSPMPSSSTAASATIEPKANQPNEERMEVEDEESQPTSAAAAGESPKAAAAAGSCSTEASSTAAAAAVAAAPESTAAAATAGEASSGEDLKSEIQRLKDQRLCKVCYEKDSNVALVPCGHLCCANCAPSLKDCPYCRQLIAGSFKIFMS